MDQLTSLEIIEIFNALGTTKQIATKYCLPTGTIAKIKGGTGIYSAVITDYKRQMYAHLTAGVFGYDPNYKPFAAFKLY